MTISEKQLEKLRALALAEEEHETRGRALLDTRHAELERIAELQREVARLRDFSPPHPAGANIDGRIQRLVDEIAHREAANERRYGEVAEHNAIRGATTSTIDAVLEHAGVTRAELGLDIFRGDPGVRGLDGMIAGGAR